MDNPTPTPATTGHTKLPWRLNEYQLLAALKLAYVENQNMHCFSTKGKLNDALDRQTRILRVALGGPAACPATTEEAHAEIQHQVDEDKRLWGAERLNGIRDAERKAQDEEVGS